MTGRILLIGNVNIDLVMGTAQPWPQPGTEIVLPHSEWRVGGAAGNSALALNALGADYGLIANRGMDDFGTWLAQPFGVRASAWPLSDRATALSVGITHPDGERTFFSSLGHLLDFSMQDVLAQVPEHAGSGDVALLSGVFVTPLLRPHYLTLITTLRNRGFGIALDTGWPDRGWNGQTRREVQDWCNACDHILINEAEARGLSGVSHGPVDIVADAVRQHVSPSQSLVIKRGNQGAMLWRAGLVHEYRPNHVAVVDTIGAGDVFNACYLYATSAGLDAAKTLAFAVDGATLAISTLPRQYKTSLQ